MEKDGAISGGGGESSISQPRLGSVVNFTVAEPRVFFLSRCEACPRGPPSPPPSFHHRVRGGDGGGGGGGGGSTREAAALLREALAPRLDLSRSRASTYSLGFSRGSNDKGGRGIGVGGKGEAICGDGAGQLQPHEIYAAWIVVVARAFLACVSFYALPPSLPRPSPSNLSDLLLLSFFFLRLRLRYAHVDICIIRAEQTSQTLSPTARGILFGTDVREARRGRLCSSTCGSAFLHGIVVTPIVRCKYGIIPVVN